MIVAERAGRAIRGPAVEAMLSYAGKSIGRGWVFGLNEAMDQGRATVGPLITALILYLHGSYQNAFAALLVSAVLCLATLVLARVFYPRPLELEEKSARPLQAKRFSKRYWLYVIAGALIGAGFADFALVAFHFQKTAIVAQKHDSGLVCGRHGKRGTEFPRFRPDARQTRFASSASGNFAFCVGIPSIWLDRD